MNDNAIIKLMQSCPDKGIYEAIRKYQGLIRTISARILKDEQDVEECISDTFFDVWRHVDNLQPDRGSLKGYLICTARNNALNKYRKNTRNKSIPQSDALELLECLGDMEQDILQEADVQTMLTLIEIMDEPDREILIRKHLMFEPAAEIAERLNMKPNQVKYRLQRAKGNLKNSLIERGIAL